MNLLGPELVRDLVLLIQHAEADDAVRVLVFKSADPAAQTLALFVTVLFIGILLSIPDQSVRVLGAELVPLPS